MSDQRDISQPQVTFKADARERALEALVACYDGSRRGLDVLQSLGADDSLSALDAGLAAELVTGVLRHRLTLEHIAAHFQRGRWGGVRPSIRTIFAMGIYQLCWLDRIPAHAAVDQSVRLAKRYGVGAASMANAILRKVSECRGDVMDEPTEVNPRRWLSLEPGRGRLFTEDILPDPNRRPLEYISAALSHPPYLVERWHRRFKPKLCRQICESGQNRPPLSVRANLLRTTEESLFGQFVAAGYACERMDGAPGIIVRNNPPVAEMHGFAEGLFQPQDSTAQRTVLMCPPKTGSLVVDLCAGLGTKSTQAAECMGNKGVVLACDVDQGKLDRIAANAERLGITIIRSCTIDKIDEEIRGTGQSPDLVLVDAPCTNTGVLARRPEARYRATHAMLHEMLGVQREVLEQAANIVGANGQIVYSTCSIEQEENEEQVDWFCNQFPGWRASRQELILPDANRGGGFTAVLSRIS